MQRFCVLMFAMVSSLLAMAPAASAQGGAWSWMLRNCNCSGPADYVFSYGAKVDIPVVGDWDYDSNKTDTPGVFHNGHWQLRNSNSSGVPDVNWYFGQAGDYPVPSGWGIWIKDAPGIVRQSGGIATYHVNTGFQTEVFNWGVSSDMPRAADQGVPVQVRSVLGSYRWYPKYLYYPYATLDNYGVHGDIPVIVDWDGNGTETPGVYRAGTWYLNNSWHDNNPDYVFSYGSPGDYPVVGDWNGDGIDTVGVLA